MTSKRDSSNDGLDNQIGLWALTHLQWFWDFVHSNPLLRKFFNKNLINSAIYKIPTRPFQFSTMHDSNYTSWSSLLDRTYSGRHLPPTQVDLASLPAVEEVVNRLFLRHGEMTESPKSTVLFSYFAQWFTDGFLRTDRTNKLKNTSTHEIDLCQLYGLNRNTTNLLRSHTGGKLKSQFIAGEEYPPYYFEQDVVDEELIEGEVRKTPIPKAEFQGLLPYPPERKDAIPFEQKIKLFALGVERANFQAGYMMFSTLFLREHNRVCAVLAQNYPDWDDDRIFETARNTVIVILLKVVLEEYINHITPYNFKFFVDPSAFTNERWYRHNWMSLEFNLLYRWHSLVPDVVKIGDRTISMPATLWDTELVTQHGLGVLFDAASLQPAGDIGLHNTPAFLRETEKASLELGRTARLKSYNDYRELCGFPRVTDFNQITADEEIQTELKTLYGTVDQIEYYVGLFAEDTRPNSSLSPLISRLVGIDAFSQALTNPLLNEHIFKPETFSPVGWEMIQSTRTLSEILHRNIPKPETPFTVSLTRLSEENLR
jgi:prostaglandin-endoperoxide synthase 2